MRSLQIVIPHFESHYVLSKQRRAKHRRTKEGVLYVSNPKYAGKPRLWRINGQDLYSGVLHRQMRGKITKYFHDYLKSFLIQLVPITTYPISISLDIYEIKQDKLPDIDNLWIWKKWFADCLTELEIIVDDNPDYIIESGYTKYHWVTTQEERKLVFNINI